MRHTTHKKQTSTTKPSCSSQPAAPSKRATIRVGIDTGGTFTDLVAVDRATGAVMVAKTPTVSEMPEIGVMNALDDALIDPSAVEALILGTTIAANARLEGSGATVIYVATDGFQDIPFIGFASRKEPYNPRRPKPDPGVLRRHCVGVQERIDSQGSVLVPLNEREIERACDRVEKIVELQPNEQWAIAVNLLFSYINPDHEGLLAAALRRRFPDVHLSVAHEVAPVWREYPRATTTILAASIRPRLEQFAHGLMDRLQRAEIRAPLALMKSNGGQLLASAAGDRSAELLLSGLAGGLIAGHHYARTMGTTNAVTLDMGGTSTDVGMVVEGAYGMTDHYDVEWGVPVLAAHLDFTCIGAGGGSIARIDEGGMLRVGPQSAGANPGPMCYGKGGEFPTVTDANLVLGRLDPSYFLGGREVLDVQAAQAGFDELGRQLGYSAEEAAIAVIDTACDTMASAVKKVTIERGLDHRDFDLVAFGGAGPLHAAELIGALGMRQAIVPPRPGLCSAFGCLLADCRVDKNRTVYFRSETADADAIDAEFRQLEGTALEDIRAEGYAGVPLLQREMAVRYALQSHELGVVVPPGPITATALDSLFHDFHEAHEATFGFATPGKMLEVTQLSVTAIGHLDTVDPVPAVEPSAAPLPTRRLVYFRDHGFIQTEIYLRATLSSAMTISGPALIEEPDSTVLVPPGYALTVAAGGVLLLAASPTVPLVPLRQPGPDMVTLHVLDNQLRRISDEMVQTMLRAAHSPLFSESLDFSCMLFNRDLELISQAEMNPAIICAGLNTVPFVVRELGLAAFEPGDVIVHNDPYRGSCHMPEHLLLKAVFLDDEILGFVGNIAHIGEIGGMAVGSFAATATEVFQEGLRLPPCKLVRRGEDVRDLWRLILANHRTPDVTWGDFRAMIASLDVGERRLVDLVRLHGFDSFTRMTKTLMGQAEAWMRSQIGRIPNGTYSFEDWMDDDGIVREPCVFRLDLNVLDDEIVADWSRTDRQANGAINLTYVAASAGTYTGILQSLNVTDVPLNDGVFRPVTIVAPPGTLVNVAYPGACVGGNSEGQPRLINTVCGAMAKALPDRSGGADPGTFCLMPIGGVHPETGEFFTNLHQEGGGWGGRKGMDGQSVQIQGQASTIQVTPVEVVEHRYPVLHLRYELREESGGAGEFRGGMGARRVFRTLAAGLKVSALSDRTETGPWGVVGGLPGAKQRFRIKREGTKKFEPFSQACGTLSDSKFINVLVNPGDEILVESPGGGGYGDPLDRDPQRVRDDVLDAVISVTAAREQYGVEFDLSSPLATVDEVATSALRARLQLGNVVDFEATAT